MSNAPFTYGISISDAGADSRTNAVLPLPIKSDFHAAVMSFTQGWGAQWIHRQTTDGV